MCECERKTANKIKQQVTVKGTGKLQGVSWVIRNLWGCISTDFAQASWEVRGWALRIYKTTRGKDKTPPCLGLDPTPGILCWGDHPAYGWQVRALAFSPASLLREPWSWANHFPSGSQGVQVRRGLGLPGFRWWDSVWMAKGVSNTPFPASHSLWISNALFLSSFTMS